MKYFVLRHEDLAGKFIDGDVIFNPPLADYYQVGEDILEPDTTVSVILDKRIKKLVSDFFYTTGGAFFASQEVKSLLEDSRVDLKILPAKIKYFNGRDAESEYYLVHADAKVACFDYQLSQYSGKSLVLDRIAKGEFSTDFKVRGINKLHVKEDMVGALDFFFIKDLIWIDPIVSEAFMQAAILRGINVRFEAIA